jgi:plastocyanin
MRYVGWFAAVVVVAVLAAGCGGGQGAQAPAPPSGGQGAPPAPGGAIAPAGGEIVVVGKDNFFEPQDLTLRAGEAYEIRFKNEGTTVHNLIIQAKDAGGDFASDIVVNGGAESLIKVKIDREGTYKVVCTYHPEMVGEVKVTR